MNEIKTKLVYAVSPYSTPVVVLLGKMIGENRYSTIGEHHKIDKDTKYGQIQYYSEATLMMEDDELLNVLGEYEEDITYPDINEYPFIFIENEEVQFIHKDDIATIEKLF